MTDDEVEAVALEIAVVDAEQSEWGRCIIPLHIARAFARAAITAIDAHRTAQAEKMVEIPDHPLNRRKPS